MGKLDWSDFSFPINRREGKIGSYQSAFGAQDGTRCPIECSCIGIAAGDNQNVIAVRVTVLIPGLDYARPRLWLTRYELQPFILGIGTQTGFGIALGHHHRGRTLPGNFLPAYLRKNCPACNHVGHCS